MKKCLCLALVLLTAFAFVSCGTQTDDNGDSSTTTAAEAVAQSVTYPDGESSVGEEGYLDGDSYDVPMDKPLEVITEVETEAGDVPAQKLIGENLQKYVVDIIATGRYTMTVSTTSDGLSMDYVAVIAGENTMQKMDMMGNIMTVHLISKDGQCYIVSEKYKRYAEISFEEFKSQLDTINTYSLEFDDLSLTLTQKVERSGKEYIVETYQSLSSDKVLKYYFRNDAIELVVIENGGKSEERKYTVMAEVDETKFDIPADYTKMDDAAAVLLGT